MSTATTAVPSDLESKAITPTKSTVLQTAKRDIAYLIDPRKSPGPTRTRTRALLRSARYIGIFIFWRLVRYAKYAAVGAVTAAIAGTFIGSVASGAAFVIAPPGILAGAGVGLIWGLGKFGWRVLGRRVWRGDTDHADPRRDEQVEGHRHAEEQPIRAPTVDPW